MGQPEATAPFSCTYGFKKGLNIWSCPSGPSASGIPPAFEQSIRKLGIKDVSITVKPMVSARLGSHDQRVVRRVRANRSGPQMCVSFVKASTLTPDNSLRRCFAIFSGVPNSLVPPGPSSTTSFTDFMHGRFANSSSACTNRSIPLRVSRCPPKKMMRLKVIAGWVRCLLLATAPGGKDSFECSGRGYLVEEPIPSSLPNQSHNCLGLQQSRCCSVA